MIFINGTRIAEMPQQQRMVFITVVVTQSRWQTLPHSEPIEGKTLLAGSVLLAGGYIFGPCL